MISSCILYRERSFPNIEVSGMSISQAIDAPITTRDTISMSGSLSSQNGNAQGLSDNRIAEIVGKMLNTFCSFVCL